MTRVRQAALAAAILLMHAVSADAQVFGTLTWQMQPFCNKVTLTLSVLPSGFTLHGFDDQCGNGVRTGAVGTATFNPDGSVGLDFTLLGSTTGSAVQVVTIVSPANGQGIWSDSDGNNGAFALSGSAVGLPPRPVTARAVAMRDVADNPRATFDPCAAGAGQATTMVLCGTMNLQWNNGGFGLPGLQVWRDAGGTVHLRGSARYSGTLEFGATLFVLPPELRPRRTMALTALTGLSAGVHQSGTALLVVYGEDLPASSGRVALFSPSHPQHNTVHLGETMFRVDR